MYVCIIRMYDIIETIYDDYTSVCILFVNIYIYTYIYRERERKVWRYAI